MGNRAVITTAPFSEDNVGIYLHWNGGIESVAAFCAVAKELGYRSPPEDTEYGFARLTGLISLYFGICNDTSLGIGQCKNLDCDGNNGVFLIGDDWKIVGRGTEAKPGRVERNPEPEKTATIKRDLLLQARLCATACENIVK